MFRVDEEKGFRIHGLRKIQGSRGTRLSLLPASMSIELLISTRRFGNSYKPHSISFQRMPFTLCRTVHLRF